jgi:hypothetical protein
LGVASESEYGKYTKPTTRFLEIESESLALTKNYIETLLIASNQAFMPESGHRAVSRIVGGDINLPFFDKGGMGTFFNMLHGEEVKPAKVEEGKAYKQVHKIGTSEPFGKSLTAQVGRPELNEGTVEVFNYLGCKIPSLTISAATGDIAKLAITVMGRDEEVTDPLETASYTAGALPFTFQQMELKAKGVKLADVADCTIAITVPQPERYRLGNEGLTSEPIINAAMEGSATATADFSSMESHKRYLEEEVVELLLVGIGADIDAEKNPAKVEVLLSAAKQISSAPSLAGPDIVSESLEFKALDGGTKAPIEVTIVSEDTAL